MQGFMRSSLLHMAVCSPPREAATRKYDAVFVTSAGSGATAAMRRTEAVEA